MSYKYVCDICGKPMEDPTRFNRYYKVKMRDEREKKFHEYDVCQRCFEPIEKRIREALKEGNYE